MDLNIYNIVEDVVEKLLTMKDIVIDVNIVKYIKKMYKWWKHKSKPKKYNPGKPGFFSMKYKRKFDSYTQFARINHEQNNKLRKSNRKIVHDRYAYHNGSFYTWSSRRSKMHERSRR